MDVHPTRQKFRDAKERLDAAREAYSRAESELIDAQRKYNEASREFGRELMGEPEAARSSPPVEKACGDQA